MSTIASKSHLFLSTLSLRRATGTGGADANTWWISIHALLAESDIIAVGVSVTTAISIHALLAESDILGNPCAGCPAISIHALLAESDRYPIAMSRPRAADFYPRSPCGERPIHLCKIAARTDISIHALLAESDSKSAQNSGALLRI